jgi:hypothetical protein
MGEVRSHSSKIRLLMGIYPKEQRHTEDLNRGFKLIYRN